MKVEQTGAVPTIFEDTTTWPFDPRGDYLAKCSRCRLVSTVPKTKPQGPLDAKVLIWGGSPGKTDHQYGSPFPRQVRAGQILEEYLRELGYVREECYLTLSQFCYPPEDVDIGTVDNLECSRAWKVKELTALKGPEVILLLGQLALTTATKREVNITANYGKYWISNTWWGPRPVVPVYHPGSIMRDSSLWAPVLAQLKALKQILVPIHGS